MDNIYVAQENWQRAFNWLANILDKPNNFEALILFFKLIYFTFSISNKILTKPFC